MSLDRHSFTLFAKLFAVGALFFASLEPAVSQSAKGESVERLGVFGSAALNGQEVFFRSPQFKVEALWFKVNDETGWYWTGSDEVYAVFSDMDPTRLDRLTAEYEADEGDTINFNSADTCMAAQPDCSRGMADLNVRFAFWESDWAAPLGFSVCHEDSEGGHWFLNYGKCIDDDFIGRGSIIHSRDELVAMLPSVGDSREFTAVMDKNAGKYRFRYRITRLPNLERSIVIHIPPEVLTAITLQANVVSLPGGSRVDLTWSGATTSTVDIFRNGTKVTTTANDGAHSDIVGSGSYQYRVCDLNSTTACSANVGVTVP